jgi:hypothetical protein
MTVLADMELIELQARTLFRLDAGGRITGINESDAGPAPRLFLGRTRSGNIWRFRDDLPGSLVRDLERALREEPVDADLSRAPGVLAALTELLHAHAPVGEVVMGPAWQFPDEIAPPEGVTAITAANAHLLRPRYVYVPGHLEELEPCRAVIVDGSAVSVCYSSRTSAGASEAGLDTVAAFRGRGYAPRVVAAWALAVREAGRVPLYSTSWDNLASRAVAGKLGLVLYGADLWIE